MNERDAIGFVIGAVIIGYALVYWAVSVILDAKPKNKGKGIDW